MQVGDIVKVQDVKNQSIHRWVVLDDLIITKEGDVEGGRINFIEDTMLTAGEKEATLYDKGITTLIVCGAIEPLSVGGIFVE